jgi:hypothetical protein
VLCDRGQRRHLAAAAGARGDAAGDRRRRGDRRGRPVLALANPGPWLLPVRPPPRDARDLASQQLGGGLGLAIYTAVATSLTQHLLAAHATPVHALTAGFQRALLVGSIFIAASALIALRSTNTRGESDEGATEALPEPAVP